MATKKQKRLENQRRRAEFEAEVRADGLKAQQEDKARRLAEMDRQWEDAHKVHLRRNRFHDKCPSCAAVKAKQAIEKLTKAVAKGRETYTPNADGKHPGTTGNNEAIDLTRKAVEING